MSYVKPSRRNFYDVARGHETIGHMHEYGWRVRWRCRVCQTRVHVDLEPLIFLYGPKFSLWNQHPQCLIIRNGRHRCWGLRVYEASPHPEMEWGDLTKEGLRKPLRKETRDPSGRLEPPDPESAA